MKIKEYLKKIGLKYGMLIIFLASIVIFVLALILHFENKHREYMLDSIYDVYPSEVKELYRYLVDANCSGDIKFNVQLDSGNISVKDIDRDNLMDYLFNYLEKKGILEDTIDKKTVNETINKIFTEKVDLIGDIKSYEYDGYVYTYNGKSINRKSSECKDDIKYISHLYGYGNKENTLYMDIKIGYLKDDTLYELDGKELGKYNNNKEEIFKNSPYYRVYYVKSINGYKLDKVKYVSLSFSN